MPKNWVQLRRSRACPPKLVGAYGTDGLGETFGQRHLPGRVRRRIGSTTASGSPRRRQSERLARPGGWSRRDRERRQPLGGVGTRFGGVWEEIARAAGRRGIRGGGTPCGRRWGLLGDALIKVDVGFGLIDAVPSGMGPRSSSQAGGSSQAGWMRMRSMGNGIGDEDDAARMSTLASLAAATVRCADVRFGAGTAYRRRAEVPGLEGEGTRSDSTRAASAFWTHGRISSSTASDRTASLAVSQGIGPERQVPALRSRWEPMGREW